MVNALSILLNEKKVFNLPLQEERGVQHLCILEDEEKVLTTKILLLTYTGIIAVGLLCQTTKLLLT